MPSTTVKLILPDGRTKETPAEKVSIKEAKENWSEYSLEDGSVVRVRPVVARVLRTEEVDSEGSPIYQVLVANTVFVDVAENLKRKEGTG
jgi:hypothetical protein